MHHVDVQHSLPTLLIMTRAVITQVRCCSHAGIVNFLPPHGLNQLPNTLSTPGKVRRSYESKSLLRNSSYLRWVFCVHRSSALSELPSRCYPFRLLQVSKWIFCQILMSQHKTFEKKPSLRERALKILVMYLSKKILLSERFRSQHLDTFDTPSGSFLEIATLLL